MVTLNITKAALEELTWEQWEQIEEGPTSRQVREICALFVVDENGAPLEYGQAYAALGKLKAPEIKEVSRLFSEKVKELQAAAVNPPTAGD